MKTYAITGGIVVNEQEAARKTLILQDGIIAAVLQEHEDYKAQYPDAQELDARGQYVVPGGVDGHVHFGGFGVIPIADDFCSGSRACLAGGTTTVVDFSEAFDTDCVEFLKKRIAAGKDSGVDYAMHFTFTEDYRNEIPRIPEILETGVNAFKAYTYYDGTSLKAGDLRVVMEAIHDVGPLLVHAEEKSIIDREKERYGGDPRDMRALGITRPNVSEQIAVETVLALAKETGTDLAIAHTSTKETVAIKRREALEGNQKFHLESCPQYMELTDAKFAGEDGALYTVNPPLRKEADRAALKEAMQQEVVDFISTDHCPYLTKYKKDDTTYETVPCGLDGVQTRMSYIFSEGVVQGNLSPEGFVRLTSTNCAKFYGLYPRKGTIRVGSDADLAFFDPDRTWTWGKEHIAGNTDYTILEGLTIHGKCTMTIKGGEIVMKDDQVEFVPGSGRFLDTVHPDKK